MSYFTTWLHMVTLKVTPFIYDFSLNRVVSQSYISFVLVVESCHGRLIYSMTPDIWHCLSCGNIVFDVSVEITGWVICSVFVSHYLCVVV